MDAKQIYCLETKLDYEDSDTLAGMNKRGPVIPTICPWITKMKNLGR
jgi:hypothetical protein